MAMKGMSVAKTQRALASAVLEWFLIFSLFICAIFSYLITKFARYCKLQIPCILCSRLDHVFEHKTRRFYWDLFCSGHKLEISSLVFCHGHDKLADVHQMCEGCLFSFATINQSNAETYRLLIGKLGREPNSRSHQDPLLSSDKLSFSSTKQCSCCNEQYIPKACDQTLVHSESVGSDDVEPDVPSPVNYHNRKKRKGKPSLPLRSTSHPILRYAELDPLSRIGYTEVKITSDTDSEAPLSDENDTSAGVHITNDINEDFAIQPEVVDRCIIDTLDELPKEKLVGSVKEPSVLDSGLEVDFAHVHGNASVPHFIRIDDGLEELNWIQLESKNTCPSPIDLISNDSAPPSLNAMKDVVEDSKESDDPKTDEETAFEQRSEREHKESSKADQRLTTASETGLESNLVPGDGAEQVCNLLDLGDAYKLAISNRGRQFSDALSEQLLDKDSSKLSEDLKQLLSQLSATRGIEPFVNTTSPRLSVNCEEMRVSDASNSNGMEIFQRKKSLERNESGLSLDGSIVNEIEGESVVDRLKRQVEHDRKLLRSLCKELEEERNASAVAANQAMAMITRLQEEKAALHMEALQYLRMMDEQSEYDMEALQKTNELLAGREKEIQDLEAKLEFYRNKFPNKSPMENMVEINHDVKVKDIELVHSESTCPRNDERILRNSVAGNPDIADEAVGRDIFLKHRENGTLNNPLLQFEDERLYILQSLKKLESCIFLNNGELSDDSTHSGHEKGNNVSSEGEWEQCGNVENDYHAQSAYKPRLDQQARSHVTSVENPLTCKENGELDCDVTGYGVLHKGDGLASISSVISNLDGRLQALEADRNFLDHTITLLKNGEEGLQFIQEVAHHLRELRKIGMRRTHL